MYDVRIIPPAENDIKDIYTFIKYQLHSPDGAERFRVGILQAVGSLKENPNRGAPAPRGTRKIFYKQYKIIYKVDGVTVHIIAVTK